MTYEYSTKTINLAAVTLLLAFCLLVTLFSTEAAAQERLQLSATSEQGAVAAYSEPLDVREHSLWGDRRAGIDLSTLRVAGAVRNAGDSSANLTVFAVTEAEYREMASRHPDGHWGIETRTGRTTVDMPNHRFLALFSIDVDPSTTADMRGHAPRDPAALEHMMADGPVRFGVFATSADAKRGVKIELLNAAAEGERSRSDERTHPKAILNSDRPFEPIVRTRSGEASLLDPDAFPGEVFFPGEVYVFRP